MNKICKICNTEKDINFFYTSKNTKDGYNSSCKKCNSELNKERYIDKKNNIFIAKKKPHNILLETRICNTCNIERDINEYQKYNAICKKCKSDYGKIWRDKNKEYKKQQDKQYKEKNKSILQQQSRTYYQNNKAKVRTYIRNRKLNDPLYKFSLNIRKLILISFKNGGFKKNTKTYNILGCTFEEFKIYIENQFESWMTLENHGIYTGEYNQTWQLDHIQPISNATNEDEVIKLNHYTNFQPLCSKKNLEKSNMF